MADLYLVKGDNGWPEYRPLSEIVGQAGTGFYMVFDSAGRPKTVYGDPSAPNSNAIRLRGGVIVTAPPPVINWQSAPTITSLATDFYLKGGAYLNESTGKMFDLSQGYDKPGRLIIEDALIRTRGPFMAGFRGRWVARNCVIEMLEPLAEGQSAARLIDSQEHVDGVLEDCTIFGGGGVYLTPKSGVYHGDITKGEGIRIRRNRQHNIDGRISDGQGSYRRTNWGSTHTGKPEYQSLAGAQIGWRVANFVQFNAITGLYVMVDWNDVTNDLDCVHEDLLSFRAGGGGTAAVPGYIGHNNLQTSGRWDWNHDGSLTMPYDASGQVMTGATSPQHATGARNSQTAIILGDDSRSEYNLNTCHMTVEGNICTGPRGFLGFHFAHHINLRRNEVYQTHQHADGTPYTGYHEAYYEVSAPSRTTADGTRIFGYNNFEGNLLSETGRTTTAPMSSGAYTANNSTSSGNLLIPEVKDGGAAAIAAYRARRAAAGVTCGSRLAIPDVMARRASRT